MYEIRKFRSDGWRSEPWVVVRKRETPTGESEIIESFSTAPEARRFLLQLQRGRS